MASTNPNPNPKSHIVFLAFPFGTHAGPLLSLAGALSDAITSGASFSFLSTEKSNSSLFGDRKFERVTRCDVASAHASSQNPAEAVAMFLASAEASFKETLEAAERRVGAKVSCVISDAFLLFAGLFAAERGVPWVSLWTAGPRSLLVHIATDEIRRRSFEAQVEEKLPNDQSLDFLPGFSNIRVSDIPEGIVINSDSPIAIMLQKMGQTLPKAKSVLINSFHKIDPEISNNLKTRLQSFLNIGPFTLTMNPSQASTLVDEHKCLEWLSRHEKSSVVYISFGSIVALPRNEVKAVVEALKETKTPFLWSYRGSETEEFINHDNEEGKLVPWAPQAEVLKHPAIGAFVTHCGWNSVLESIVAGVPMICRPFFGDQRLNSRTVEAVWGIGVLGIDQEGHLTRKSFVESLRRVLLVGEEGKGMRERVCVLKRLAYEAVEDKMDFNTLVELIT